MRFLLDRLPAILEQFYNLYQHTPRSTEASKWPGVRSAVLAVGGYMFDGHLEADDRCKLYVDQLQGHLFFNLLTLRTIREGLIYSSRNNFFEFSSNMSSIPWRPSNLEEFYPNLTVTSARYSTTFSSTACLWNYSTRSCFQISSLNSGPLVFSTPAILSWTRIPISEAQGSWPFVFCLSSLLKAI